MKEFTYTITDPIGIHARPAGLLAKEAAKFESVISVIKGEKKADTRRLMSLMALCIKQGETITVTAEGADEDEAVAAIEKYFIDNKF